jgi:hypothetical protein
VCVRVLLGALIVVDRPLRLGMTGPQLPTGRIEPKVDVVEQFGLERPHVITACNFLEGPLRMSS